MEDVLVVMFACWLCFRSFALRREVSLWLFHSVFVSAKPMMLIFLLFAISRIPSHLPVPFPALKPFTFWKYMRKVFSSAVSFMSLPMVLLSDSGMMVCCLVSRVASSLVCSFGSVV